MTIVSQDRRKFVNYDNVSQMDVVTYRKPDSSKTQTQVRCFIDNKWYIFAVYFSEKEALNELHNVINAIEEGTAVYYMKLRRKLQEAQMPEEETDETD